MREGRTARLVWIEFEPLAVLPGLAISIGDLKVDSTSSVALPGNEQAIGFCRIEGASDLESMPLV